MRQKKDLKHKNKREPKGFLPNETTSSTQLNTTTVSPLSSQILSEDHIHLFPSKIIMVLPQHIFAQYHARRPQHTTTAILQVLVELEWRGKQTVKIDF